jgi:hypothetical protein
VFPKVNHLGVYTLPSTIIPATFVILLILMYPFCNKFLTLGKLLVLNKYINIYPSLVVILVFLGIHPKNLATLKHIQDLALWSFLAPQHELRTFEILF